MKYYYVIVLYSSRIGNPCSKNAVVKASTPENAINALRDRVSRYKWFWKHSSANATYLGDQLVAEFQPFITSL